MRRLQSFFDLEQLTSSQQALVTELEAFFESDDHVFLLLDGAGTGKTFMAKGIAQWLQHRDLVLHHSKDLLSFSSMAYTGR